MYAYALKGVVLGDITPCMGFISLKQFHKAPNLEWERWKREIRRKSFVLSRT